MNNMDCGLRLVRLFLRDQRAPGVGLGEAGEVGPVVWGDGAGGVGVVVGYVESDGCAAADTGRAPPVAPATTPMSSSATAVANALRRSR